jgi:hypothetical protein
MILISLVSSRNAPKGSRRMSDYDCFKISVDTLIPLIYKGQHAYAITLVNITEVK